MYLRKNRRKGKVYWTLVETYRTERGPRQRVVSYLSDIEPETRAGVQALALDRPALVQGALFDEDLMPDWQEIDTQSVTTENSRGFGDWWVGLCLMQKLGLCDFLEDVMPAGREDIPWSKMALATILCRLCDPSSELRIAEAIYERSPLPDLLGIPIGKVNDDRLYRTLDALLPHKDALQKHLGERMTSLFDAEFDILLYDVTSTFFEGQCEANPDAKRGYSRDQRSDCKQVNIGLVVSRSGLPLGFEMFPGNTHDSRTVEQIVSTMEERYGKANRIWVMDRGMVSAENVEYLKQSGRRFILGAPKASLRKFEQQIVEGEWSTVRDGVEAQICKAPDGDEVFILCRSADRRKKDSAIRARFEERIEAGLTKIAESCTARKWPPLEIATRVGKLLGKNTRAEKLFQVEVQTTVEGNAKLVWSKRTEWQDWATLSEGCYLLRSNITDWKPEELWEAYIQLTQAEAAFHVNKSDLQLRPIWHQTSERVTAHIMVCFIAFALWKTLGEMCKAAGLGGEPRRVLDELREVRMIDVVMRTRGGHIIRRRTITQPTKAQAVLLKYLKINLPKQLKVTKM